MKSLLSVFKRKKARCVPPVECSAADREIIDFVMRAGISMASEERLWATLMAVKHTLENNIAGDIVECGVWRGGNALIAAELNSRYGNPKRIFLYDTFLGMTEPGSSDKDAVAGIAASQKFADQQKQGYNNWCFASLSEVEENFSRRGLLSDRIVFVPGDVSTTLLRESNLPGEISVLRLDTDWYESTKKELDVLYPRLTLGGVILLDDYGHWAGCRKAVDEYFEKLADSRPLLTYTDYTGRLAVKYR